MFSIPVIAVLAAVPLAVADFDIYLVRTVNVGATVQDWSVFNGPPDCIEVRLLIYKILVQPR